MDPHHRKIDLQSPSDLTYLLNNIKAAAREKIDLAIPRSAAPQGEDAYREKVEELVQQYIVHTLSLALPSLSINGFDASPTLLSPHPSQQPSSTNNDFTDAEISAGNYEPYDPRLAERLRSLYAQCELESETVAKMRREVPAKAAKGYREGLEREMEAQRGVKQEENEKGGEVGGGEEGGLDIKVERREEVEGMWRRGLEGLERLGDITGVLARVERAGRAVEVVEGL